LGTAQNVNTKERIYEFTNELIAEGEAVLNTEYKSGRSVYVELRRFKKWRASCNLLMSLMGDLAEPWQHALRGHASNSLTAAKSMHGTLQAIRDAIDNDLLVRFEDLVFAEAFSDLVEQAEYLFDQGYILASGVILRAVLEERLRRMCNRRGCDPQKKRPTIADYNMELYKAKVYDKITLKHVESMAAVGNDAAHNNPDLDKSDVERFKRDLVSFLAKYSS
jgi:hypothetical protein